MTEYHKIKNVFRRDDSGKLIHGNWTCPEFEMLKDIDWLWTEKVDGTNIRVMWDGSTVTFGGKTDRASIPSHLVNVLNHKFTPGLMSDAFGDTQVCLYGEGYGVKINGGGGYISDGVDFILFDVKIGRWWLKRDDVDGIASTLVIDVVPVINYGSLLEAIEFVGGGFESVVARTKIKAEGVIVKPAHELYGRGGDRVVAKIKHRDFKVLEEG